MMPWRRFFSRTRRDVDHAREFQAFLELEIEENLARGLSPDAARRAAHRKFGNATAIREEVYEMNSIGFLETLGRDVRYAARVLKAAPTYTLVSLVTLAFGIGATTAIFTVINGVILQPLPYPDPGGLVTAWETNPAYNLPGRPPGTISFSPGNYLDLRDQNRAFEQVGAFATTSYNLTGGTVPDRVQGGLVSASLFSVLGVRPAAGRPLVRADDTPAAERVALISHSLWLERFGGRESVVGSSIRLDDRSHTIVGVMPAGFRLFSEDVDVWLPLERKTAPENMRWRESYYLRVIARLKPGVTVQQAGQDIDRVVRGIRGVHPADLGQGGAAVPLLENTIARARGPLLILFGAVGFVLLIACANIANLNLGRAMARRREMSLRLALGASRGSVVRQLFTESMMLSLGGAAAGLMVAEAGVRALLQLAPGEVPRAAEIHMDVRVLAFAVLAAAGAGVISGLLPALAASKTDLQDGLRGSDRSNAAGPAALRGRMALAASEIALALVLMIGAGLLIESFRRVSAVDPGFDPRALITMRIALSPIAYDSPERQSVFYQQLIDRLRGIPGALSVGAIDGLPFTDGGFDNSFRIDGRPEPPPGHPLQADIRRVDSGYFRTMGIDLVEGRGFSLTDRSGAPAVVIVSQSMARRYWPGEPAVGKRLTVLFGPPEGIHAEIVGVASDVRPSLDARPGQYIYMHYPQGRFVAQMDLVVRRASAGQASADFARAVRGALASLDPEQPVYRIRTMDELMRATLVTRRFEMLLLSVFAAFAACLAAVGLYGVLAYSVAARTKEIGIRAALGARRSEVLALVLGDALKPTAAGLAAGVSGALGLTRLLSALLYEVQPADARTFARVSLLLLAVALSASYLPARRAAGIDPMTALRHE